MLDSGIIEYAIIEVRGADDEEVALHMAAAAEVVHQHDAIVEVLTSGLVIITRGTLPNATQQKKFGPFISILRAVQEALKDNVRIAFKREYGHFGNIGSNQRFSYSFIAPGFITTLKKLLAAPFGSVGEYE